MEKMYELFARLVGEFLATMIYCIIGCLGSSHSLLKALGTALLANAACFGLGVATAMQCFLAISGAHLNPCVTIAAFLLGIVRLPLGLLYILMEFLGAFAGAGVARLLNKNAGHGFCVSEPSKDIPHAIGLECLLTSIWVLAMCTYFESKHSILVDSLPLRMGVVVFALHLCGGLGASMNPARSIAAAVIMNQYDRFWIYLCFPPLAAILATLLYAYLLTYAFESHAVVID